jgi:hypothetical protein
MKKNTAKVIALKAIVNSILDIDVDVPRRTDDLIKGRAICYKIMRDEMCFTYTYIGNCFGKKHATILHSYNDFPYMIKFDQVMSRNYDKARELWERESWDFEDLKPLELKNNIKRLSEQYNLLTLSMTDLQAEMKSLQRQVLNH